MSLKSFYLFFTHGTLFHNFINNVKIISVCVKKWNRSPSYTCGFARQVNWFKKHYIQYRYEKTIDWLSSTSFHIRNIAYKQVLKFRHFMFKQKEDDNLVFGCLYTGLPTKYETLETTVKFILSVSLHSRFPTTVNFWFSLPNQHISH